MDLFLDHRLQSCLPLKTEVSVAVFAISEEFLSLNEQPQVPQIPAPSVEPNAH